MPASLPRPLRGWAGHPHCVAPACRDGKSRQFGFVGFRNAQEAQAAVHYFNKSFLDTSRLVVEVRNFRVTATAPLPP
jgi:hypothetical protein